jgi:prepilin-type processing-associated H-X9-DG protein
MISTRKRRGDFAKLDGAFANPRSDGTYSLGIKNITDGTSKTLLAGETNYALQAMTWDCPHLAGSPKWGDQTWALGYWADSWGHMSAEYLHLYNNRADYVAAYSERVFRSDHAGGVYFVFLDGSVRFVPDDSDSGVRLALVTRAGEETNTEF